MIIIKLSGRLGNQMFQYAFARAMSMTFNTAFKLDKSWFDLSHEDTPRQYELGCFNLDISFASMQEVHRLKGRNSLVSRVFKKMGMSLKKSYVPEKYYHYDPSMKLCGDDKYFDGYWQSYRYFDDFLEQIKEDFLANYQLAPQDIELSQNIATTNSVSLHVRRGDYITNPNAASFHGVSSLQYYYDAIAHMSEHLAQSVLYIFSDDIAWVKENLHVELRVVFVENRASDRPFDDIYLMHLCKHNIIANSSFSWWGAHLNKNPQKIVIAPKKWFNDTSINTDDLIPKTWVRM